MPFFWHLKLNALLQTFLNKWVKVAIQHTLRIADFHIGAQIFNAALVENIRPDLVAPADVGFGVFNRLFFGVALVQLKVIQRTLQHIHRFFAVAVLASVVLALHHDIGGQMRNTHGRIGLVNVLAARATEAR